MLKRFPEYGRKPAGTPTFSETLRYLIVGRIHAGLLRPGDRLPSIRDMATRSRVDHRVAARAYRQLESEGLVEVRPKSGVFVTSSLATIPSPTEGGSWAAEVLLQGWQSGISRSSICGLFGGMLASPLRCGCIESNEDHMVALRGEIEDGLSLETVSMLVPPSAREDTPPPEDLDEVDVVVTSVFHAAYARRVAAAAGKPVAVLNLRGEFSAEIAKRLAAGAVTVVIADPEYARKGREFFSAIGYRVEVRYLTVEEARLEGVDPESESVLLTRAARRRMGLEEYHLVPFPMVSAESARELCEIVTAVAPARRPRLKLEEPARDAYFPPKDPAPPAADARAPLDVEAVVEEVERTLRREGLFEALRALNRTTEHRFTAIYRFEPGWVRSHLLFDRENPHLRVGADVPMKESYCVLVGEAGTSYRIDNALTDARLVGHKAREAVLCYCAVHLVDSEGASWGTLCHYDFRPAPVREETITVLEAVRPAIQRSLGPAAPHVRLLPDCPGGGPAEAPRGRARARRPTGEPWLEQAISGPRGAP